MKEYTWVFFGITALSAAATFFLVYSTSNREQGKWEGSVETRLDKLEEAVKEIYEKFDNLLDLFLKRGSPVANGKSPLTLTELGKEIATMISARHWVQEEATKLFQEVVGKHPYEIEELCFQHIGKEVSFSEEMDQKIRKAAYEKALAKKDILDVLALELRDELISRL